MRKMSFPEKELKGMRIILIVLLSLVWLGMVFIACGMAIDGPFTNKIYNYLISSIAIAIAVWYTKLTCFMWRNG